jgi:GDP-4-dehydro-6-deoxy-D-mannose reductase
MRVLVTGASGFVGRWLTRALADAGHEPAAPPRGFDVTDAEVVRAVVGDVRPDAIAHLAAVAFAPDAGQDPERAVRVNVGGTVHVMEAVRAQAEPPVVLVAGSSEVYGVPRPEDLPLHEGAPLRGQTPYALSKLGQESAALAYASRNVLRVVVTRSFNHIGPGQRRSFVVPALAERVRAVQRGEDDAIPVGNLDVRRDLCDVRDVVAAYVALLERLADGRLPSGGTVLNVCSGRSTSIRWVLEELCRQAGVEPVTRTDPGLVRAVDAPDIRGDGSAIRAAAGWHATTPLGRTLADVWAATQAAVPAAG